MENKRKKKPDYDKLSVSIQFLLRPSEAKILNRMRRESPFPSNAAFVRAMILECLKKKNQTELF